MLLHSTDRFVPEPPYKLTSNHAPPIYVPLSDPGGPTDSEFGEFGPSLVQTSDTPSTPTSMPRKRKREQAYFDSPSGSLVFSGFDKDGMPRRPRKLRKLRFDPSFSPEGGRSRRETVQGSGLVWPRDHHDALRGDGKFSGEHGQDGEAGPLRGYMTTVRSPATPDKPLANEGPATTYPYRRPSADECLSKSTHVTSPAISIDKQKKMPPVRTIHFTNLPPPTSRWGFAEVEKSRDTGMILSVVKPTDPKVKTPKKISFANHAQVCVYMVSPQRSGFKDGVGVGPARPSLNEGFKDGPKVNDKTWISRNEVKGSDDSIAEATNDLAPRTDSSQISNDPLPLLDGDQSENDTLALTMEEVRGTRRRLLELAAKNGVDNGQLATLFELGKTFRGVAFHHVW
ncbi:hypothetical protein OG21DRAFT_1507221 [Imleria badia]|nr:hypothetical protein OG21DRAFT_1507221 [Imleria badia]